MSTVPADSGHMSFWSHLDTLRGVFMRIAAIFVVAAVASFCVMPRVFDTVILAPCHDSFPLYRLLDAIAAGNPLFPAGLAEPFDLQLASLQLTSQFVTHMTASCWLAAIVTFPMAIYLLWGFVSPALYDHERRGIRRAFVFGNLMFYLGVATAYWLVFPLAVRFLATYQLSPGITAIVSLDSYMETLFTLVLLMGIVFELPLVAWLLGKMGLLTRRFFSRFRRHAVVALLIVAGLVTPTGDPFTMLAVFIPIYALWELSARLVPRPEPEPSPSVTTTT